MTVRLIDTHAHLDMEELSGQIPAVLSRAAQLGVSEVITIGVDLATSIKAVEVADAYPQVYATVGIHPHDAFEMDWKSLANLRSLARGNKVLAIGEIGLDYYRDYKPRDIQRKCLRQQLELAGEESIPVVFHIRDAYDDFLSIIKDYIGSLNGVVLHCFSGDLAFAEKCLAMGCFISIPGTVTFPKAASQHEVARRIPLDRLLIETDSPYLAPIPYRGKVNEPAFVYYTAKRIAELREIPIEELASHTTRNAHHVFRIDDAFVAELAG